MRKSHQAVCAILASALCPMTQGQASRLTLHIEAQPMRLALKDLGQQTGLSIVFREGEGTWGQLQAPPAAGELSAREALEKMLANSGLQFQFVNPTTVLISTKESASAKETAFNAAARFVWGRTSPSRIPARRHLVTRTS